jgi:predicted Rossmann fold flavoprotein
MIPVIIIGGGASGLMLSSLLPSKTATIIEHNAKLGAKILISGGGRCNVTNANVSSENYLGDQKFVSTILKKFNQHDMLAWCNRKNLNLVIQKNNQYFCPSSAKELQEIFAKDSQKQSVILNQSVIGVSKIDDYFIVKTNRDSFKAKNVVVASGGLSYTTIGASGIGYEIATLFGHSIKKTAPALVGFTLQKEQFFMKELSGTAIENVNILVGGKVCSGALLFAHKGVSGPCILDASLYWEKGTIEIDFLPDFDWHTAKQSKKNISTILPLAKRVLKAILDEFSLPDKPYSQLSKDEQSKLHTLKSYKFAPAGTFGYNKAEVTKGGVDTSEIDELTMMSQKVENLYFIGEVLDVTGELGGYNFQWAFSTATVCAKSIR